MSEDAPKSRLEDIGVKDIDEFMKAVAALNKKALAVKESLKRLGGGQAVRVDGKPGAYTGLKKATRFLNNCMTKIEDVT